MSHFRFRVHPEYGCDREVEPGQVLISESTGNRWRVLASRQVRPHPSHDGWTVWSLEVERMRSDEPDPPLDDLWPFRRDYPRRRRHR